jgi:hypothetical protein
MKTCYRLSLAAAAAIVAPMQTAAPLMMAAAARTSGQMVPGPIENRIIAIAANAPVHSAAADAHGLAGRQRAVSKASRSSATIIGKACCLELSHHPFAACSTTAAENPRTTMAAVPVRVADDFMGQGAG